MLKAFFRQREAQRLNRDAVAIIEADTHTREEKSLVAIAVQVDQSLKLASQSDASFERMMQVMKNSHRKARDERNQVNLSAATLAIIYLRAKELGETARPARDAVEHFVGEYCPIAYVDSWEREW